MKPVALITGGTRGIGLGIAIQLAKSNYDLVLNGVRRHSEVVAVLEQLKAFGAGVMYVQGDIGSGEDRKRIVSEIQGAFDTIHVLVNNAGVAPRVRADLLEVEEEDFDWLMDINLKGTFFLTQAMVSWMLEAKKSDPDFSASVVNITSVSAIMASVNRAEYCLSKAGLSMMSKLLALRLAEHGISVYEVRPGIIETDMTEKVKAIYQERIRAGLSPEPRMGLPEDVGKAVLALVRGDFPYATGQVIHIDGGLTVQRL